MIQLKTQKKLLNIFIDVYIDNNPMRNPYLSTIEIISLLSFPLFNAFKFEKNILWIYALLFFIFVTLFHIDLYLIEQ